MYFKGRILISFHSAKVLRIIFPRAKSQTLGRWKNKRTKKQTTLSPSFVATIPMCICFFTISLPISMLKVALSIEISGIRYISHFTIFKAGGLLGGSLEGFNCRFTVLIWEFQITSTEGFSKVPALFVGTETELTKQRHKNSVARRNNSFPQSRRF